MAEVTSIFNNILNSASGQTNLTLTLLFFTAVIVIYSVFIFYFYKFLAKKNIIELNLAKYNTSENSATAKLFAGIFYIIEYIILLPVLTFFWFAILAILVLVLAEGIGVSTILLIAAALVASVRVTSYISQSLSQDLAKMIPFTLIGIAITKPAFFNVGALISRFTEIPLLFQNIPTYLIFIVAVELIMRIGEFISTIGKTETEETEE